MTPHMHSMKQMLPRKVDGILDNMAQTMPRESHPHLHHSGS